MQQQNRHLQLHRKPMGFTLIEMSIVLVIISLIITGIIGGKSLLVSARNQNIIYEINNTQQLINTFKLQYDALPGDFREATDYWPSAGTMSGNGDNFITGEWEPRAFWAHLFLAEISPYSPAVIVNGSGGGPDVKLTCPTLSNIGYDKVVIYPRAMMRGATYSGSDANYFQIYQQDQTESGTRQLDGFYPPRLTQIIDKKLDDGFPGTGDFRAAGSYLEGADCLGSGNSYVTGAYPDSYDVAADPNNLDDGCRLFSMF